MNKNCFNDLDDCSAGRIYFCTEEYILDWLFYNQDIGFMFWIREVTIPDDAQVEHISKMNKFRSDKIILGPRQRIADIYYIQAINRYSGDTYLFTIQLLEFLLKNKSQTLDICVAAVSKHPFIINQVNYRLIPTICLRLVETNGMMLRCIPVAYRTHELCVAAFRSIPYAIEYVPEELIIKSYYDKHGIFHPERIKPM